MRKILLSGSILDADFAYLWEQVKAAVDAGLDMIHFDMADGCFVPNLSFGPLIVKSLRKRTNISFDVHLMVTRPEDYIAELSNYNIEYVYFHYETTSSHYRLINLIRSHGMKTGVAINPSTPVTLLDHLLDEIDAVLVMLVEPGFGGQKLMPSMLNKVKILREIKDKEGLNLTIAVDGGIKTHNIKDVVKAGADLVIVGSGIFKQENISEAVKTLKNKINEALTEV